MKADSNSKHKIPVGVFDPFPRDLSLEATLDKVRALGFEAMEIVTGC